MDFLNDIHGEVARSGVDVFRFQYAAMKQKNIRNISRLFEFIGEQFDPKLAIEVLETKASY